MATITDNRVYNVELAPAAYNASAPDILAALRTTEAITLTVDYATGSVPPLGTLVHNQAEATALGVLKTCQDVMNVMPPYRDFPVIANILAGAQYAPNNSSIVFMLIPGMMYSSQHNGQTGTNFSLLSFNVIKFIGARSVVYSGIAGTTTNDPTMRRYKFTRTAGTWTVDELKKKFITIQSGSGAGGLLACIGNSTTEAYFQYPATLGSCTINIEEPATTLYTSSNGGSAVSVGFFNNGAYDGLQIPISIQWCKLGDDTTPWKGHNISQGYFQYKYCNITGCVGSVIAEFSMYLDMQHNIITLKNTVTNGFYAGQKGVSLQLVDNLIFGAPSSSYPHMIYMDDEAVMAYCAYNRVMPDAGFTGAAFFAQYNVKFYAYGTYGLEVFCADQACTGMRLEYGFFEVKGPNRITFNNCGLALVFTAANVIFNTAFIAPVSGTNLTGWFLNASKIQAFDPSTVAATTAITMYNASKSYPYTLLANPGDMIQGSASESIMRLQ